MAGLASVVSMCGAEWPTDGNNPKRTAGQQDEKILNKTNVRNMKLLWKLKLDNQPQEMNSLFPALIVERVTTTSGAKEIAIVAGSSDNVYAIDVAAGKLLWKRHFDYPPPERRGRPGDPLCPPGLTATPTIGPPDSSGARIAYALAAMAN